MAEKSDSIISGLVQKNPAAGYRRMLNEVYLLKDDPAVRDRDIAELKARLLREGLVKSSTPIGL